MSASPRIASWKPSKKIPARPSSSSASSDLVRFDLGSRALYAADSSNYRQLPIGVVFPARRRRCRGRAGRLPRHRSRRAAARRGHQPCRPMRQRRRGLRLLPLHERARRHRSRSQAGARRAGHRSRPPARSRRSSSPHLRARSRHALPLHARRHDRQQQLRRPRPAGRQSRRQRGIARHRSLRRHAHDRGRTTARRARRAHPLPAAAWARSTPAWRASATATPPSSAKSSRAFPAASPATTSTSCCPRTASTWPARWSALRAPAPTSSPPRSTSPPARPSACSPCWASAMPFSPPMPCRSPSNTSPSASKASMTCSSISCAAKASRCDDVDRLPDRRRLSAGRDGRLVAGRSAGQGRSPRPRLAILALPARGAHLHAGGSRIRLACARIRSGRHGLCSRRARPLGGLGRCRRSARAARRLSARHQQLMAEYGYRSPLYGHYGQGCVHMRINFDFALQRAYKNSASSSIAPPMWCSPSADRSPASTATARPARLCCPKCSAPSSCRPSASSRRSGTRTTA